MGWGRSTRRSRREADLGDLQAFEAFYRRNVKRVVAYFARRTFDVEVAYDLAGETFAIALERRAQLRATGPEQQEGWLFAIARSQLSRWYDRGQAERSAMARVGVDPPGASEADLDAVERWADLPALRERVREALRHISPEQRAVVVARVLEGRSYAEIAGELNLSQDAVRARLSRGLRLLAELLEPERDAA